MTFWEFVWALIKLAAVLYIGLPLICLLFLFLLFIFI